MRVGLAELVLILVVVLLVIGPRRLPELARGVADAIAEFRKGRGSAPGAEEGDDRRR